MLVAIDFGLSNLKLVYADAVGHVVQMRCRPAVRDVRMETIQDALAEDGHHIEEYSAVVVTGGRSAALPDTIEGVKVERIREVEAIGRGGLLAAGVDAALVVSCGSGTAAIAARPGDVKHVSGTAVGGGTLCGLGQLLFGIDDAVEIDRLALLGNASALDLTLRDAVHGPLGSLPPDATAVNFGRAAEAARRGAASQQDMAASLVTMVAQTVALIAIGAARAEQLDPIVLVGHLPALPSIAAQLQRTAQFYGARVVIPADGVFAPARGALAAALSRQGWQ
jgi:type II pantothenate kinase